MTPQEQAEWKARGDKDIARIERQERWMERGRIAWRWGVFGVIFYAVLTESSPPPVWSQLVVLTVAFLVWISNEAAERKREAKRDQLRSDLLELNYDRDYESTQVRWNAYYHNITGHYPDSTITIARRAS